MIKEIQNVLSILSAENIKSLAIDSSIPLEKGGPIYGKTVTEEEKQRVSDLSRKFSVKPK